MPPTRVVWHGEVASESASGCIGMGTQGRPAGTIVRTSESFEGWLVWLFRGFFKRPSIAHSTTCCGC